MLAGCCLLSLVLVIGSHTVSHGAVGGIDAAMDAPLLAASGERAPPCLEAGTLLKACTLSFHNHGASLPQARRCRRDCCSAGCTP